MHRDWGRVATLLSKLIRAASAETKDRLVIRQHVARALANLSSEKTNSPKMEGAKFIPHLVEWAFESTSPNDELEVTDANQCKGTMMA